MFIKLALLVLPAAAFIAPVAQPASKVVLNEASKAIPFMEKPVRALKIVLEVAATGILRRPPSTAPTPATSASIPSASRLKSTSSFCGKPS